MKNSIHSSKKNFLFILLLSFSCSLFAQNANLGQQGWCCHEGNVFETTEEKCAEQNGYFFFSKKQANSYCKEHFPKQKMTEVKLIENKGWCCKDGEVFPSKSKNCERQGGAFFPLEEQAMEHCRSHEVPLLQQGWCCKDGETFPSNPESCERIGGIHFPTEEQAVEHCMHNQQPPDEKGWCCSDGDVHPIPREECERDGGTYFGTREEALNHCIQGHYQPREEKGWCCKEGEVIPIPREECDRGGGYYFETEEEAMEHCRRAERKREFEEGWCCGNGKVFPSNIEECKRIRGMFFETEEEAMNRCQIRGHIQPDYRQPEWRQQILQSLENIKKYRFNMVMNNGYEFVMDGEIDLEERNLHLNTVLNAGDAWEAEIFWMDQNAYGLPKHVGKWLKLNIPGEPTSYLHSYIGLINQSNIINVEEININDENCIEIFFEPDIKQIISDPKEYILEIFPNLGRNPDINRENINSLVSKINNINVKIRYLISRQTWFPKEISIESNSPEISNRTEFKFFDINDKNIQIIAPSEVYKAPVTKVPFGAVFFDFQGWEKDMRWGGWCEKLHCKMTDKAINLIKDNDKNLQYQEIYKGYPNRWIMKVVGDSSYYNPSGSDPIKTDHPAVIGSWAEDASDTPRYHEILDPKAIKVPNFRSLYHFGGEGTGLEYQWYFVFWGAVHSPLSGSRYASARDWGLYGGGTGDRMNFQGAIDIYNHYTYEANQEAYRRLGHTLHLLEDQAQPDHAALKDHAASSYDEDGAFKKFYVCPIIAAEAYLAAEATLPGTGWIAAGVATLACELAKDDDDVGFEYLTCWDDWNYNLRNMNSRLKIEREYGSSAQPDPYYNYFKNMADFSINRAKGFNLPLGIGYIEFPPFSEVPGLNPAIDKGDEEPYLKLADDVIVKGTNKTAGLMQHFYEVVNHPPYIQEVVVCQTDQLLTIEEVTGDVFPVDPDERLQKVNIIYNGWWECQYGVDQDTVKQLKYREMKTSGKDYDPTKYTFILALSTSDLTELKLKLKEDISGRIVHSEDMQKIASTYTEEYLSTYHGNACDYPTTSYYGVILNQHEIDCCGLLALEFTGEDNEPHFSAPSQGRKHSGKELDSNPVTIAVVDQNFPHQWIKNTSKQLGYEPGTDKNHKFRVYKVDAYEANDDRKSAQELSFNANGATTINDLTFHSDSDVDFFYVSVPIDSSCMGVNIQNLPITQKFTPSMLQICAKTSSTIDTVIVTVFKENTKQKFELGSTCNDPLIAGSAAFFNLEDQFPDGIIKFKVAPKANSIGQKVGCYSLKIKHSKCSFTDNKGIIKIK